MQGQEPQRLTCINAGPAGCATLGRAAHTCRASPSFGKGASMFKPQILCAALIVATVTGCDKPAPPTPRPGLSGQSPSSAARKARPFR